MGRNDYRRRERRQPYTAPTKWRKSRSRNLPRFASDSRKRLNKPHLVTRFVHNRLNSRFVDAGPRCERCFPATSERSREDRTRPPRPSGRVRNTTTPGLIKIENAQRVARANIRTCQASVEPTATRGREVAAGRETARPGVEKGGSGGKKREGGRGVGRKRGAAPERGRDAGRRDPLAATGVGPRRLWPGLLGR